MMLNQITITAVLFLSQASLAQVLMADSVTVSRDFVQLSDVADLSSVGEERRQMLGEIPLYRGLKPGQEVHIPAAELSRSLRRAMTQLGIEGAKRPLYRLPKRLSLRRGVQLTAATFSSRLIQDLAKACEDCRFEIEDLKIPQKLLSQACELWSWDSSKLSSKAHLLIPVTTSCGPPAEYTVSAKLRIFKKGAVSRNILKAHTYLLPSDLREDWVEITFARDEILKPAEVQGRKLKKRVNAGVGLFSGDLAKEFDVRRGQLAKVAVGSGNLEVISSAIAEQDGVVGDYIRLKHPATGKLLSGRVYAQGEVRVE